MKAPTLVFGWGNRSRGDDALGPLFVERLLATRPAGVEGLDDYQLQVEHALDLVGRRRVLFVDASRVALPPFETSAVEPAAQAPAGSHALAPAALLRVHLQIEAGAAPACTLLAIRGQDFALGAPTTAAALAHLDAALAWAQSWLAREPA